MKKLVLVLAIGLISGTTFAQERVKEISYLIKDIGDDQLIFKKQNKTKPYKFRRISFSGLNNYGINLNKEQIGLNLNIGIGYEKRKQIGTSKFTFYKGPEFITSINVLTNNSIIAAKEKFKYNVGISYSHKRFSFAIENQSFVELAISPIWIDNGITTKIINPYLAITYKL